LNAAIFTTHRHWPGPLIGCGVHLHTVGLLEVPPNRWRALLPSVTVTVTVNQATGLGYARASGSTTPGPRPPGRAESLAVQVRNRQPRGCPDNPSPGLCLHCGGLRPGYNASRGWSEGLILTFRVSSPRDDDLRASPELELDLSLAPGPPPPPGPADETSEAGGTLTSSSSPPWPARRRTTRPRPGPSTSRFPAPYV
jgi:hypothetical protein